MGVFTTSLKKFNFSIFGSFLFKNDFNFSDRIILSLKNYTISHNSKRGKVSGLNLTKMANKGSKKQQKSVSSNQSDQKKSNMISLSTLSTIVIGLFFGGLHMY